MCHSIRMNNMHMTPGHGYSYVTSKGLGFGIWGLAGGKVYNLRSEGTINQYERGIIYADSFEDGGVSFGHNGKTIAIPVVYNKKGEFAVLTRPAAAEIKNYHHRMPFVVKGPYSWIFNNFMDEIDYHEMIKM